MILSELRSGDRLVATELVVGIMEGSEHLEEAEAGLLSRLGSSNDIRVSGSIKVVLDLFKFESTITIGVKLVESFVDEALAEGIQLTAESCQKFVETDLTISTGVEDVEKTLSIASAHAWNSVVIEDGLELTER